MHYRVKAMVTSVIVGSLLLAACGSSKGSSTPSTTAAGPAPLQAGRRPRQGGIGVEYCERPRGNGDDDQGGSDHSVDGGYFVERGRHPAGCSGADRSSERGGGVDGRQIQLVTVDDQSTTTGDLDGRPGPGPAKEGLRDPSGILRSCLPRRSIFSNKAFR